MSAFEIKDCALLTRMSGLPPAVNLRELRERIAACSADVLYHHFCETPLVPSIDYPDYRKDFAIWARRRLGDQIVRYLLHHRDTMERMGNAAREFVRENFLLTRHLRDYLTLFTWVLKGEGKHKITI